MKVHRLVFCLAISTGPLALTAEVPDKPTPRDVGTVPCAQMGPLVRYSMVTVPVQNAAELRRGQFVDVALIRKGDRAVLLRAVEVKYIEDGAHPLGVTFKVTATEGQKLRLVTHAGRLLAHSSDCIPRQG